MNTTDDPSRFRNQVRSTGRELDYRREMDAYIAESAGAPYEKFEHFTKYTSRQTLARFLALYEIFKQALDVQGDVIECGVNLGGSLMTFAQLSAVLEPVNLQRRVIGFDTFAGFPSLHERDISGKSNSSEVRVGGYAFDCYDDVMKAIQLFDLNRFIGHIEKVLLVKGDACDTIPRYLVDNPHTVVSLLHLDFDLYEPTKVALEAFVPRMPKGAVIIFDELNNLTWPGETQAALEVIGLSRLRIRRFPFEPHISYAVVE